MANIPSTPHACCNATFRTILTELLSTNADAASIIPQCTGQRKSLAPPGVTGDNIVSVLCVIINRGLQYFKTVDIILAIDSDLLIHPPKNHISGNNDLEIEGFIYTRKGKGCYVAGDSSSLIEEELTKIMNQIFDEAIEEAKKFKLDPKQIKRHFEQRLDLNMEGDEKGEKNG